METKHGIAAAACILASLACSGCDTVSQLGWGPRDDSEPVGLRLADDTLSAGAPDAALHVADGLLEKNPHNVDVLVRRGRALQALGRPAEAAQVFAEAQKLRPERVDVLIGLAEARAASGDAANAETLWRSLLKRAPSNIEAAAGLAVSLDLQGKHDAAQAVYRSALAQAPDTPALRSDLGLSLALSGHTTEALPFLQQGAEGETGAEAARARHDVAVGMALAGDEAGARTVLEQDLNQGEIMAALAGLHQLTEAR
jgi:Flp pilus assembly protein TadD